MTEILCSHEVSKEPSMCSWEMLQPLLGGNTECEHPCREKNGAQGGCSSDAMTPVYTEEVLRHKPPRLLCLPQAPQTFPPEPSLWTDCPLGTAAAPATLRVEPLESLCLGPLCCAMSSEWPAHRSMCSVSSFHTGDCSKTSRQFWMNVCLHCDYLQKNHWNLPFVSVCVRSLVYECFWGTF